MNGPAGYDEYGVTADLYDCVTPYPERTEITFFVDAATAAGSPILEIGCGTGRVLIPTARAGPDIVGLDASARMLAVCRERLQQESAAVQARIQLVRVRGAEECR
jgi:cyclopropane fatty-acyl-phospholipid synthase-like methyltransferase